MIDRQEWLEAHGFVKDPFLPESFHAETDMLLMEDLFIESYVDMKDARLMFGDLIGDYYLPGSRFIFSKSGGGKSGIRKRIHFENNKIDLLVNKPKVLAIDYVNHDYSIKESSIKNHINRLVSLVEKTFEDTNFPFNPKKIFELSSPRSSLNKLINFCARAGYNGIYVLVDNINIQTYEKILPLALNTELNKLKGLVIKFFIPEELFVLGQQTLPFQEFTPAILQWEENELTLILRQRLSVCLKPELELRTSLPGISVLCDVALTEVIQKYFLEVGKLNGPGGMWEFGYHLLEEHMKSSRQSTDMIGETAFINARLRMLDTLLKRNTFIDYGILEYYQNKYRDILKSSTYRGNKAKIFLSCIPEDRDIVYDFLFKPLESENYKPLMIQKNISPGENLRTVIDKMVEESDFFIPCFSSATLKKSDMFHYALRSAKEKQLQNPEDWIFVIPALIGKSTVTDAELRMLQTLDLSDEDFFLRLLKALEKGLAFRKGKNYENKKYDIL